MTLRDKFFLVGCVTTLVVSLLCSIFGPPLGPTWCLFAFWGYLGWAEIVLHVRAKRHRQKSSDLYDGR